MKKLITLFAIAGMVLTLAPAAQAAITLDGMASFTYNPDTPTPGDWQVTFYDARAGALTIAGGSQLDMNGFNLVMGWGSDTTVTVTGDGGAGTASKLLASSGMVLGQNVGGGILIVEDGGWADVTGELYMGKTGAASISVTGVNSKLTASTKIIVGGYAYITGKERIVTVADSGLVQTAALQFGFDGGGGGYVHMGVGGVLAVSGDKTGGTPFAAGGLFTINGGGSFGEIQYNPSGDGTTWVNMTGATEGVDYSLTYETSGDLSGYTVLTMLGGGTPGTLIIIQ
jgi:hypothetical protein